MNKGVSVAKIVLVLTLILNPILSLLNIYQTQRLYKEIQFNNAVSADVEENTHLEEAYQYSSGEQKVYYEEDGQVQDTTNSIKVSFNFAEDTASNLDVTSKHVFIYLDDIVKIKSQENTVKIETAKLTYLLVFGEEGPNPNYDNQHDLVIYDPKIEVMEFDPSKFNMSVQMDLYNEDHVAPKEDILFGCYDSLGENTLIRANSVYAYYGFGGEFTDKIDRIVNTPGQNQVRIFTDNYCFIFYYSSIFNEVYCVVPENKNRPDWGWSYREFEFDIKLSYY